MIYEGEDAPWTMKEEIHLSRICINGIKAQHGIEFDTFFIFKVINQFTDYLVHISDCLH